MIVCREIRVRGRVQGVNFRYHAKEEAQKLGISGCVRNCDDGTVLIFAQGEEEQMNAFMEWCCKGPSRAMVLGLEVVEIKERGYQDFKIVR